MGGALIRRIALMVLVCALPVHAVIGDLNLDDVVNLQDFFLLADNFGREEAPEVCEDPDTPGDDGGTELIALGRHARRLQAAQQRSKIGG